MINLAGALLLLLTSLQGGDYCKLKGSVYIEDSPKFADYVIYQQESEAFADMLIFEEENRLFADKPGKWYFVENKGLANFTVYFTDDQSKSHFSAYFIDSETFAGCQ